MHYLTLVAVDIPEVKEEPKVDAVIKSAIEELKGKNFDGEKGAMSAIVRNLRLERLCAMSNAFSRAVDDAVSEAMEPYCENTEDPRFLEFVDMTESAEKEYQTGHVEMVRLPEGKYVFPHSRPFSDRYIVSEGKVLERNAGPCKHAMRTKRAKKMQVVNRAFRKVYTSLKDYAEEYCCYTYEADRNRCGYYSNPKAFWDWYQIGGRWPYELLVKTDCKDFSIGERDIDYVLPQTPAGYMWVSAARKKDIAWDAMREWRKQQALISFAELEKAFAEGVIPSEVFGKITEKGISGFREIRDICSAGRMLQAAFHHSCRPHSKRILSSTVAVCSVGESGIRSVSPLMPVRLPVTFCIEYTSVVNYYFSRLHVPFPGNENRRSCILQHWGQE